MESDDDSLLSPTSSVASFDEDDVNVRRAPNWCAYRHLLERHGYRLDTCRDVKQWYQKYWEGLRAQGHNVSARELPGYTRACSVSDENELCKDAGLPDNLFRGTHCATGGKVVIKAVHLFSREYDVVRHLSSPALRSNPMNHLIPIYDLIEVPSDYLVFIVMEEWHPLFVHEVPRSLKYFLGAMRRCIEHIVFMHSHHMAHLDISVRNLLTDYKCHYAYIDFECARRFDGVSSPLVRGCRGTDLPPELERGEWSDPYKADVWSLAILVLRSCKMSGYNVPELVAFTRPMLHPDYAKRPSAAACLRAFDNMVAGMREERLRLTCQ